MERFVLTKDIVRFGKWFVQPCLSNERLFGTSSQHLSFSFTFFVHGDTVCASIDLREHPAVRPLSKEHLTNAAAAFTTSTNGQQTHGDPAPNSPEDQFAAFSGTEMETTRCVGSSGNANGGGATNTTVTPKLHKVILAPFGMAAVLTGNSYKANDPIAAKILEDWASFFPLCNKDNTEMPPVVEVISGGHKMYHPSIYVLVTDLDDMEEMELAANHKDAFDTTSSTEAAALAALSVSNLNNSSITTAVENNKQQQQLFPQQQQHQQQHQDIKPVLLPCGAIVTTTATQQTVAAGAAISSASATTFNSAENFNSNSLNHNGNRSSTAPALQQSLSYYSKVHPYYDTTNSSSFTCNTANTHCPPQAATEMPERVWQDSITNQMHVAYCSTIFTSQTSGSINNNNNSSNSGNGVAAVHAVEDDNSAMSQADNFSSNNTSNAVDSTHRVQKHQQQQIWSFVDPMQKAPCICTKFINAVTTPHGTPLGGTSTYSRNSVGDSLPVPSVGSPGTPAQSPHPNSALSQPTSVPPADQLLAMSPRAPISLLNLQQPATPIDHLLDKNTPAPTPTDQHDNKSITASPYPMHLTPGVDAPASAEGLHGGSGSRPSSVPPPPIAGCCTPPINNQQPNLVKPNGNGTISVKKLEMQPVTEIENMPIHITDIKVEPDEQSSTLTTKTIITIDNNGDNVADDSGDSEEAMNNFLKLYQSPNLDIKDADSFARDDCSKLHVLYDFSFPDAWCVHPMKRFKPNESAISPSRSQRIKNMYDGQVHSKPLMPSPNSQLLNIKANVTAAVMNNISMSHVMDANNDNLPLVASGNSNVSAMEITSGVSDNNSTTEGVTNGNSTLSFFQNLDIKTEIMSRTASPCKDNNSSGGNIGGNLYTAEGLHPSLNDLEQLFETSSNDECGSVQIHTPPDSNNPSNGCPSINTIDDLKRSSAVSAVGSTGGTTTNGAGSIITLQNCSSNGSASVGTGSNTPTSNGAVISNVLNGNGNSSNSGSGNGGSTVATSNNTSTSVVSSSGNTSNGSGTSTIQAEDLTKMFPTPPSHDQHHPNSSPCQMDIPMTDLNVITTSISSIETSSLSSHVKVKQEYSVELGSPVEEPIEDWSFVFRPLFYAKFVGSSKYAPLNNLPSQIQQPLSVPGVSLYKPTWTTKKSRTQSSSAQQQQQQLQQQQQQTMTQHHQQLHDLLSAAPRTPASARIPLGPMPSPMRSNSVQSSLSSGGSLLLNQLNCPQAALTNQPGVGSSMHQLMQRTGMSPISPAQTSVPFPRGSPMMQPQRQTPIHPPPPYEMAVASPATSTSSYLNKQFHSQETPQTPQSVGMSLPVGDTHSIMGNVQTTGMLGSIAANTQELPEVSSLIVNILLYDTALNVFRDHNFDSSTVCVCNATEQEQKVGNIRGADSGVYVPLAGNTFNPFPAAVNSANAFGNANMRFLNAFGTGGGGNGSAMDSPASLPGAGSGHTGSSSSSSITPSSNQHISGYVDDDPVDCTCGFSAVVNRRLAHRAGLFYEDEMEITGVAEDPSRHKKQTLKSLMHSLATALSSTPTTVNSKFPFTSMDKSGAQTEQGFAIFELLLDQITIIQTSTSSIHRALQRTRRRLSRQHKKPQSIAAIFNILEFVDANDVMCLALEQARLAFENSRMEVNEFAQQHQLSPFHPTSTQTRARNSNASALYSRNSFTVHKWPYIPVGFSRSNKDIVCTMNSIQPMLQNAFHSKSRNAAGAKDATYTVTGPLTWRQFHRLAGRASGQCEPQPIPSVIVGHDKDWISLAPLAIPYWDKLLLEPYSYARDIVYLIVCPDNDVVISKTKSYFKELSTTYEMCKLGRHTPMRGWDGMLTVGGRTESFTTSVDDWLRTLEDAALADRLRLYANALLNTVASYLSRIPNDKTLLNPPEQANNNLSHSSNRERSATSPTCGNSNLSNSMHSNYSTGMEGERLHASPKMECNSNSEQSTENSMSDCKPDIKMDLKSNIVLGDPLGMGEAMEELNPPEIVIYVVEPFTFGTDSPELERVACVVLLRIFTELQKSLPESVRTNLNFQIISLESIFELGRTRNRKRFSDEIKCVALNMFSQCRRHLVHQQSVKSLTGFGTAANMESFLKSKDEKNRRPYRMYTPPYILAPMHEKNDRTDFSRSVSSMRSANEQKYSVMYCNYCISEDQTWLLTTVTDDRGELMEKMCINIDVPNRAKRVKAPARRIGLKKLMDFIMGLISQTAQPWRLVIGRIGRIGHSELKSWSYLLSKQNLQKSSKQLKDICKQCSLMYPPSILSACLVTLEPDAKLRVMPDQFTPDERFSQISMQNPLSTPQDVTCTHILVFPTSAVCLSFTRQFQNEPHVDLDNDFLNFDECEEDNDGFTDADLGDLLDWGTMGGQLGRLSNHGSPDRMEDNRSWQSASGNNFNSTQQQEVEEVGAINQQPLAVGYMVSTAPTGRMPAWFWSACPHLEDVCPVFLKTALHLHVPNIQTSDDILNSTNAHSSANDHALDSSLTADVLRFVLEGYNALSWLALDSNTHDRLSCLPVHVQVLMDLYYLIATLP